MTTDYGVLVGQVWDAADGSDHAVFVVDVDTATGDALITDFPETEGSQIRRIDLFKLARVRYCLRPVAVQV